mmetsp:Transcript_414/g.1011  ORF Transcript_414/g.1011 Transcript_414/m.1011 type:complete len:426 (+) Transcript_414:685-1962(+)
MNPRQVVPDRFVANLRNIHPRVLQTSLCGQPLRWVQLQQRLHQALPIRRNPRPLSVRKIIGRGRRPLHRLPLVPPIKRHFAAQHDIQNHPAAPHIHRTIRALLFHDLRRDVPRCANHRGGDDVRAGGLVLDKVGEAEVRELDLERRRLGDAEDVFGLEVAVDDAVVVEVLDAEDDLGHGVGGLGLRELCLHGEHFVERSAGAEVHDHEDVGGVFEDVKGLDEVLVGDRCGDVDFALELLELLVREVLARHFLDGDLLAGHLVLPEEYLAERALPELLLDGVVVGNVPRGAALERVEPHRVLPRVVGKEREIRRAVPLLDRDDYLVLPRPVGRLDDGDDQLDFVVLQRHEVQRRVHQLAIILLLHKQRLGLPLQDRRTQHPVTGQQLPRLGERLQRRGGTIRIHKLHLLPKSSRLLLRFDENTSIR